MLTMSDIVLPKYCAMYECAPGVTIPSIPRSGGRKTGRAELRVRFRHKVPKFPLTVNPGGVRRPVAAGELYLLPLFLTIPPMGVTAETALRLTPAQKDFLLRAGRSAMEAAVRNQVPPPHDTADPVLLSHSGAFVTLTISGELRGCIGYFEPVYPLVESVTGAAVKAALDDHRFPPVRVEELPRIRLEISVLSRRIPVNSIDDIVVGRDGLYIEADTARGLLLPQVATEYRWDAERFLFHTFRKCGLPPAQIGAPGIAVFRFIADVFSENRESRGEAL
jgi:AmmeMemoRadiSam system protein A